MLYHIPTAFSDKNGAIYKQAKINFSALIARFSSAIVSDLLSIFNEDALLGLDGLSDEERLPFARLVVGDDTSKLNESELKMIADALYEVSIPTDMPETTIDIYVTCDDGSGFVHINTKNVFVATVEGDESGCLNVGAAEIKVYKEGESYKISLTGLYEEIRALFGNNPRLVNELNRKVDDIYLDLLDKKANVAFASEQEVINATLAVEMSELLSFKLANFFLQSVNLNLELDLTESEFNDYMEEIKHISENKVINSIENLTVVNQENNSVITETK